MIKANVISNQIDLSFKIKMEYQPTQMATMRVQVT